MIRILPPNSPALVSVVRETEALAGEIEARIKTLRTSATDETRKRMTAEAQELRARKLLATHQQTVLDDIERRKKYAAYGLCIDETKTQTITQKSTAVTKTVVSQRLKRSFSDELVNLSFHHVEVELKELGGADGVFYHKLVLTRAPGVDLPKVVSEGEQRCLSIAAFFAELSTADDPSGIVFDDPVSSLDYQWRQGVARRLVSGSQDAAGHRLYARCRLPAAPQAIRGGARRSSSLTSTSGSCPRVQACAAEELPWVALPVKKKIGYLKNGWQAADKLSRDGHQDAYEKDAKYLYGLLREAWERALEEVLLGGVVERYRPSIQTQQVAQIADITAEDCKTVETAMTKCSKWLPGHDQAAAARAPVPGPAELKADIEALDNWVAANPQSPQDSVRRAEPWMKKPPISPTTCRSPLRPAASRTTSSSCGTPSRPTTPTASTTPRLPRLPHAGAGRRQPRTDRPLRAEDPGHPRPRLGRGHRLGKPA